MLTAEQLLDSIREWCFPEAIELPLDSDARCEVYARRLLLIANAALVAKQRLNQNA